MIILQTCKSLNNLVELPFNSVRLNEFGSKFCDACVSVSFVAWFIFMLVLVDLIRNAANFKKVCAPLIMVSGHVIIITIYWRFLRERDGFKSLLDNLQDIVDGSTQKFQVLKSVSSHTSSDGGFCFFLDIQEFS